MPRRKEAVIENVILILKYTCDGTEVETELHVQSDLTSSEQACDLCGSHGSIEIDIKCKHCGRYHVIKLKEW